MKPRRLERILGMRPDAVIVGTVWCRSGMDSTAWSPEISLLLRKSVGTGTGDRSVNGEETGRLQPHSGTALRGRKQS